MASQGAASAKPDALLERYQILLEVSDVIHACQDLAQLFSKLVESLRRVVAFAMRPPIFALGSRR